MSRLPTEEAQRLARGYQRVTVRYRCAPATTGKLCISEDEEFQRAWILNISKTGVGLTLSRPLSPGTFVVIHMRQTDDRSKVHELPAHVMHATVLTTSDWLIGCELITPLTSDELDAFL